MNRCREEVQYRHTGKPVGKGLVAARCRRVQQGAIPAHRETCWQLGHGLALLPLIAEVQYRHTGKPVGNKDLIGTALRGCNIGTQGNLLATRLTAEAVDNPAHTERCWQRQPAVMKQLLRQTQQIAEKLTKTPQAILG